ncbi:MAG: extracellular solute-binding protein [Pseudomonadota bacterium]
MDESLSRRRIFALLGGLSAARLLTSAPLQANDDTRFAHVSQAIERLNDDKPEQIRLLAPAGSEANLAPIIREYRQLTGISVKIDLAPVDDINTQLLLGQISGGRAYDLVVVATFGIPDLVSADAIMPIDDLEARFPFARESRESGLYRLGDRFGSHSYGPQVDGDLYVMFYNNAVLNDPDFVQRYKKIYGEPPTPAQTWDQLDRLMRVAQRADRSAYGGLLFRTPRYIVWEFWSRMHAAGVLPFDNAMEPQLADSRSIAALEAMISSSASLHRRANAASLTENWELFCEGRTLCNIGWGGSQKFFARHSKDFPKGITVTQLPGIQTPEGVLPIPYFNWGWNLVIPTGAPHPELGFLLAALAVEPEVSTQAVAARDGFFDPFQPAHYTSEEIEKAYGREFLAVHQRGMQSAIPDLYISGHGQYMEVLSHYLVQADRGFIKPLEAMQAVTTKWRAITQTLGVKQQQQQWQSLLKSYPAAYLAALA